MGGRGVTVLLVLLVNLFCGPCYVALVECPVLLEGIGCPTVRPVAHVEAP
mgnify:CR=1 FL=1